ncbi:MAG: TolC family protein, partial [Nitrospirae bacterium]
ESHWSLIGGIEFVPFAGGQKLARLKKAEAELRKLKEDKKRATDLVMLNVRKTYLDYRASVEKLKVTEKAVTQAEENLRLQKLRYKEGVGTATEVTDAVTLLSLAETNRARALYEKRRAIARFLRSLGEDLLSYYATGGER